MKICVLQPDYSASTVDYRHYDPPRDLAVILPQHDVHHVALDKRTTYRQIKALAREGHEVFINLCEGYLEWDVPSIDVIQTLERLDLPFTGPPSHLYDPSKPLMKYVAHTVGVASPAHALVHDRASARDAAAALRFPLFVKPAHAGDSLGIDEAALVVDEAALLTQVTRVLPFHDRLLVEEFIAGREFTVLVLAGSTPGESSRTFLPIEYRFADSDGFKTYALKTSELHPSANVPVTDTQLASRLQEAARRVFAAFGGVGYARMDFRLNAAGELFFLEVNFACSMFYTDGFEGSADHILRHDGVGPGGFAELMVAEGIARHRGRRKRHRMAGNSTAGYGIVALEALRAGELVFRGEERAHRLVTRRHVLTTWDLDSQRTFARYAVPVDDEICAYWDADPAEWAPQNHSCDPNTAYDGLNVVARREIAEGEELTFDYGTVMNGVSESFACRCGAPNCRGTVRGAPGASLSALEATRRGNA
ncbi:MAG: SET domain-containing protein-lysine N-methyltransferase [Gemmatimonadota bacterium]